MLLDNACHVRVPISLNLSLRLLPALLHSCRAALRLRTSCAPSLLHPMDGDERTSTSQLVARPHNLDSCGPFHKTRPQARHANLPRLLWLWVFNHRSPLHHCLLASTFRCQLKPRCLCLLRRLHVCDASGRGTACHKHKWSHWRCTASRCLQWPRPHKTK